MAQPVSLSTITNLAKSLTAAGAPDTGTLPTATEANPSGAIPMDQAYSYLTSGQMPQAAGSTATNPASIPFSQAGAYLAQHQLSQAGVGTSPFPQASSGTSAAVPKNSLQALAQPAVAAAFGTDPSQWNAFNQIVNMESGWNPTAANPTSSARGLFQFLSSTAPSYGLPADASTATPQAQIAAGVNYIKARYGTPTAALQFHLANGWY